MTFRGAEPDAQGRYPRWVYVTIAGNPDDPDNRSGGNRGVFTKQEREILFGSPEICKQWGHSYHRNGWGTCHRCGHKQAPYRYGAPPKIGRKRPPMRRRKEPARTPKYPHSH